MKFLLAAIGSLVLGVGTVSAQDASASDPSQLLEIVRAERC
jgi:hypothetical protein